MNLELSGKRVIVAGGSAGIGLAAARLLLDEGARVAVLGRDPGKLKAVKLELQERRGGSAHDLQTVAADVRVGAEVEAAVDRVAAAWGGLDGLIDSVGSGQRGLLRDLSAGDWEENWRLNVLSAALLARVCHQAMRRSGGGSMVFLGAASGKQPTEGQLVSNVHKAGLMAFVSTLAVELAPDRLRVNLVCPGRSMSPRRLEKARQVAEEEGTTVGEYFERLSASVPLGRLSEPDEVAALAVFLLSRRASYITGQSISVDGGMVRSIL